MSGKQNWEVTNLMSFVVQRVAFLLWPVVWVPGQAPPLTVHSVALAVDVIAIQRELVVPCGTCSLTNQPEQQERMSLLVTKLLVLGDLHSTAECFNLGFSLGKRFF